ncbi:MAG: hypothetical protein ACTHKV_00890 [Flavipsychrobacter sp.]
MKKLYLFFVFFLLLMVPWLCSHAQSFTLQYLYYANDHHTISITSNKPCNAAMRINWVRGGIVKDSIVTVPAASVTIVMLPAGYTVGAEIRIKSDAPCSSTGWISITVPALQALPVKLQTFYATIRDKYVLLQWATSTEENLSHFELQRSVNGSFFSLLSEIKAFNAGHQYNALDMHPMDGSNFYRLKMVDIDGRVSYSPIVRLSMAASMIKLYEVFTVDGKKITTAASKYMLAALQPGQYVVRSIYESGACSTQLLIVN